MVERQLSLIQTELLYLIVTIECPTNYPLYVLFLILSKTFIVNLSYINNDNLIIIEDLHIKKNMKIGNLQIENPLFLAPMAGVTDHPFRVICRQFGAGVVYTEFVSSNGIIRENMKTLEMMKFTENERPIGIQLFGEFPEVLAKSAKIVEILLKIYNIGFSKM